MLEQEPEKIEIVTGKKPFNFADLIVPPDRKIPIVHVLSTIPVGRPSKTMFFRVRTGVGWEPLELFVYTPKGAQKDSVPFLALPVCWGHLQETRALTPAKFYIYIVYGSNQVFVDWIPTKVDQNGNINRYHTTRMEIYELAKTRWVRMRANTDGGYHECSYPEDNLPDPIWAEKPVNLEEAIRIAFKDNILDSLDHPEMKKLRGKLL